MNIKTIAFTVIDKLKNDFHVPVAILIWGTITIFHFYTGKDIGTNYVNSIYATYGFLGAHAGISKWTGGNGNDNDGK